jgi:dTDP-4-amino-4,6-dideoxygalactose transaminase
MADLALLGGTPVLPDPLPGYRSMGDREREAVIRVMDSDCLSGYFGSPGEEFWGGPEVRAFEDAWRERFGVRHAIAVNSATSGLFAAMGAVGIGPGDEVIVPPWTMSATVMAPLLYGGIPVFADVEPETFCINPAAVRAALSPRTKAIIAVNLFGHPARLGELRALADESGIRLIEDNAQAPLASEHGRPCGTIGHIGIFSLNFHKHIHTGEGGVCVTNDDGLAQRLQLIRNHGENALDWLDVDDLTNMVGFNFRMTELSAAVGIEQLRQIDRHVESRERLAEALSDGARGLAGLTPPRVRKGCRHNYYCWTMLYDEATCGVRRKTFGMALAAEGFPHFAGYVEPLYLLPAFQRRIAIGGDGYPFTLTDRRYDASLCPVTERLYGSEALLFEPCAWQVDDRTTDMLIEAIQKVHAGCAQLADYEREKDRSVAV